MNKRKRLLTSGIATIAILAPNMAFANENIVKTDSSININLEKKSVVLGSKSKVSVKFKEKQDADSITLNYMCYDMPLSATINYNPQTDSYEGEIFFNKDPENLNVWELQSIDLNKNDQKEVLDKEKLTSLGLNLSDYDVTQECIIDSTVSNMAVTQYIRKTAAPTKTLSGATRFETAIGISKEGWPNGSNKVIIVNAEAVIDGVIATPLATTYDAPILITNSSSMPDSIKSELKRLNPRDVIIVGDQKSVSKNVENQIKSTTNSSILRLNGGNRYDTSLLIAKEIDKYHDVNKVYMANAYAGEVDALTIAAKAGQDKQPIILTDKNSIPSGIYSWLKSENLDTAYFIGGEDSIAVDIIHKMADITPKHVNDPENSIYKNRISGKDRHETNAKVIERFYPDSSLDAMLVAESNVLVDAITAGPLGASLNSPILITPTTYVSAYHETNLKNKSAGVVYKVSGKLRSTVMNSIASSLSKHTAGNKTVVLDAGHGGVDPGAGSNLNGGAREKDYALDTTLAATEYLRSQGVNVVLTRDTDKTLTLGQRSAISNAINTNLFASVHYNASNGSGNGVEVYYNHRDASGGPSKTAAKNVLNRILEKFSLKNRGIKTRLNSSGTDYLYVLRNTNAPAILIECAFIDNAYDMGLLNSSTKVKTIGTQIGKGIEDSIK